MVRVTWISNPCVQNSVRLFRSELNLVEEPSSEHLLAERYDVWCLVQIEMFMSPHLTSRTPTSLNLVKKKRCIVFPTYPLKFLLHWSFEFKLFSLKFSLIFTNLEELLACMVITTFSLNRLDYHPRDGMILLALDLKDLLYKLETPAVLSLVFSNKFLQRIPKIVNILI